MSDSELPGAPTECQSIYKSQPASLAGGKRRKHKATRAKKSISRKHCKKSRRTRGGVSQHKRTRGGASQRRTMRGGASQRRTMRGGASQRRTMRGGASQRRRMRGGASQHKRTRGGASQRRRTRGGASQRRRMRGGSALAGVPYTPSYSASGVKLAPSESALANPVPIQATNNCGPIPRN
jgi:hypothetical protein